MLVRANHEFASRFHVNLVVCAALLACSGRQGTGDANCEQDAGCLPDAGLPRNAGFGPGTDLQPPCGGCPPVPTSLYIPVDEQSLSCSLLTYNGWSLAINFETAGVPPLGNYAIFDRYGFGPDASVPLAASGLYYQWDSGTVLTIAGGQLSVSSATNSSAAGSYSIGIVDGGTIAGDYNATTCP